MLIHPATGQVDTGCGLIRDKGCAEWGSETCYQLQEESRLGRSIFQAVYTSINLGLFLEARRPPQHRLLTRPDGPDHHGLRCDALPRA